AGGAGEDGLSGRRAELLRGAGFTVADRRTAAPPLELSDLDGRPGDVRFAEADLTLVYFWFSSCAPCVAELPALGSLARDYAKRRLRVLPLCVDRDAATVRALVDVIHGAPAVYADPGGRA